MAVEVYQQNMADLRPAGTTTKRNFNTALSTGPFSGDVVGHWRGFFVQLPGQMIVNNQRTVLCGQDLAGTGAFSGGADWAMRIPGETLASPTGIRMRPQVRDASGGTSGWTGTESDISSVSKFAHSVAAVTTLYLFGVTNTGTNASPTWRNWCAVCPVGGTATSFVAGTATVAGFLSGTTQVLLGQLLGRVGSVAPLKGTRIEEYGHANGDFPWDTVNARPSHQVIEALARASGAPTLTFETMISGQNANSLSGTDYPNLRVENSAQGKGQLVYRYTLRNMLTGTGGGLTNTGTAASGDLALQGTAGGIFTVGNIVPVHWLANSPSITEPPFKGVPTRGLENYTYSGTYQAGTTTMERRWTYDVGVVNSGGVAGNVVPGFDWADIGTVSGGNWSFSENLPVGGPYMLTVRDKADTTRTMSSSGWEVGTTILLHGQSSMQQVNVGDGDPLAPLGTNSISLAADATARAKLIVPRNVSGGTVGTYAQPVILVGNVDPSTTPAVAQGAVAMANTWAVHNPRHPLFIANPSIDGTNQGDWADNITVSGGHASWKFMGTVGVLPDATSGNNGGVMELFARFLSRRINRHGFMWTPGIADNATGATSRELYRQGVIDRFTGSSVSTPWVVFPVWRVAREPTENSGNPSKRQLHVTWVNELNVIAAGMGIRGPCWTDPLMIGNIGHSAWRSADNIIAGQPGDQNREGQAKLGLGIGWAMAWSFDPTIKAHGPRVISAWTNNSCATVNIELGRQVRALDGVTLTQRDFWVSLNNGVNWFRGNNIAGDPTQEAAYIPAVTFSVTFAANNTRAVLTPSDGGTAWETARAAGNLRFDYAIGFPYYFLETSGEITARPLMHRIPYDNMSFRGDTDVSGTQAGTPLQGTSTIGTGSGLGVTTGTPVARLVTMERFTGTRSVTVRMMASDGVTVLKEKTVTITAS